MLTTEVLVIGCGIAGGTAALELADAGHAVTLVTRSQDPAESNTRYAQGGIMSPGIDPERSGDSPARTARDIHEAGHGHCWPPAVDAIVRSGDELIRRILLERIQVPFDRDAEGHPALAREAAHSTSRILHAADATGEAIQHSLLQALQEHARVTLLSGYTAIDLLTPAHHSTDRLAVYESPSCVGAYLLNTSTGRVQRCLSSCTILATGGLGQLFLRTTNPAGARGDGVAMAHRAGARVINSEYIQFHPTTFHHPHAPNFLISEAVRGAGARLVDEQGRPFMTKFSQKWGDLAPRDVVSRGIHQHMLATGTEHVYLDAATSMSPETILREFPTIHRACLEYGVDMTREPIPVVPAAHYSCGGVAVDTEGRTSVHNLYAVGETACSGVHGANRLASSSLLEGLVWGANTAAAISSSLQTGNPAPPQPERIPEWQDSGSEDPDPALIQQDMSAIRHIMWNYVGLVRTERRLERAMGELRHLETEIERFYRTARVSDALLGLRNAVRSAVIVATAAWENRESIGCHYRA